MRYIKTAVLSFLRFVRPNLSGASILAYHSIGNNPAFFTVSSADFERQLRYLNEKKIPVISLRELVSRIHEKRSVAGCVVLTFDDGFVDTMEAALPLLEKYEMPATVFVITGSLGQQFHNSSGGSLPIMSADQVRELSANPLVDVMPHSVNHPKMSEIALEAVVREAEDSRHAIESLTSTEANMFAYPKGRFTPEVARYFGSGDWLCAVGTIEGVVVPGDDLFSLKRNSVDSSTNFAQFKAKVSDAIEIYARLRDRLTA